MSTITRHIHVKNLVRELAENRTTALECVREALSNAKDHGAGRVWLRTERGVRDINLFILDDGSGMDERGLAAFWGVGASHKTGRSIGYKGHGTKLYFDCARLSVATRRRGDEGWTLSSMEHPAASDVDEVTTGTVGPEHRIFQEISAAGEPSSGTAILMEGFRGPNPDRLLSRQDVEAYCDWFTVLADVRSGLFSRRVEFHDALLDQRWEELRSGEVELRPMVLSLRINGEQTYSLVGRGASKSKDFLAAWRSDVERHGEIAAFGHRFADEYESAKGANRVQDDSTSLRLTGPADWVFENGISVVGRVEGHRRQRESYPEASWQGSRGLFKFEDRFGLWLCKDFIPVTRRPDLLLTAIQEVAERRRTRFEFKTVRNWHVFVNYQGFTPTANRTGLSNEETWERAVIDALKVVIDRAFRRQGFADWVARLQSARLDRQRDREVDDMRQRLEEIREWMADREKKDLIDVSLVQGLVQRDEEEALAVREPRSEQELFHVFGMMESRWKLPLRVVEYNANEGIDAVAVVYSRKLLAEQYGRVEFKFEVAANHPLDHFFDAIDLVVCWKVGQVGELQESSGGRVGALRVRKEPVLEPAVDTHEIVVEEGGRVIPVLQVRRYFGVAKGRGKR
jgi:hypothetical protein